MLKSVRFDLLAGSVCALGVLLCLPFFRPESPTPKSKLPPLVEAVAAPAYDPFGIEEGVYQTDERPIQRNETFSELLSGYGLDAATIHDLADAARPVFDVRHLRAGKSLHVYTDERDTAQLVVYQPDPIQYVVFDLRDSLNVYRNERPVKVVQQAVHGVITSSPYETLVDQGADPALAIQLSEVFAWQIDFYRIQHGDRFAIVYEEQQVDGEPVGLGRIVAARFEHAGKNYTAYYLDEGEQRGYFDTDGESLRKAFLKAPLKYSRISSRYTMRRFHPVQKRWKAHLGTDYAAPTGTPIHATGDGVVLNAGYTRGNGNYVKIRHNNTYTTGYLHMSKIGKGIRAGTHVQQGDVIGYVGSTGLATGPHLCYRFWKNGQQVDPYAQNLPTGEPVSDANRLAFERILQAYGPFLQIADEEDPQVAALPLPVLQSFDPDVHQPTL